MARPLRSRGSERIDGALGAVCDRLQWLRGLLHGTWDAFAIAIATGTALRRVLGPRVLPVIEGTGVEPAARPGKSRPPRPVMLRPVRGRG